MAMTATVQSALPVWDETIVPALRKRLEGESRILAKRMSIASVSSVDDTQRSSAPSTSPRSSRDVPQTPRHLPDPRKSSAIPRPSLQYSRTSTEPRPDASSLNARVNGASFSPSVPPRRARTYSQPPSPNGFTNNPLPTPDSSRPTSPRASDIKPTRIPISARTRTTSTSSHAQSIAQRAESRNGSYSRQYQLPTPDTSQDRTVKPYDPPQPTTPPMASIRHQASSIMNEPAPFATSSITSSIRSRYREPIPVDPRISTDSEERPFEHWYRGDVHRNGGVGELRVAKHVEMLQIANYGHNLRKTARAQMRDFSNQMDSIRGRKRADSVDAGTHESLYLDDERAKDVNMVLDETPLTDIEADTDTDPETFYDAYAGVGAEPDADETVHSSFGASTSSHPLAQVSSSRSQTPTNWIPDDNITPKSTHPQAAGDPLRSGTPSAPLRTSAESTTPTSASIASRPRAGSRATSPTSQSSDQSHTKRRAKSPAAPSPGSTPKKAKTRPKAPPTTRKDDPRNSIATYPTPEGDIVNAIPTWTQPVQRSGTWDEVVLPVVARKKGLDGQYEHADGSPKPRPPESPPIKPAPGTFGYDYTKYRPPQEAEEIQMHEFGRLPEPAPLLEEEPVPQPAESTPQLVSPPSPPLPSRKLEQPVQLDPRQTVPKPPDSPAPFSHYRIEPNQQLPTINITRPSLDTVGPRQVQEDEDVGGGCCKCVIM